MVFLKIQWRFTWNRCDFQYLTLHTLKFYLLTFPCRKKAFLHLNNYVVCKKYYNKCLFQWIKCSIWTNKLNFWRKLFFFNLNGFPMGRMFQSTVDLSVHEIGFFYLEHIPSQTTTKASNLNTHKSWGYTLIPTVWKSRKQAK